MTCTHSAPAVKTCTGGKALACQKHRRGPNAAALRCRVSGEEPQSQCPHLQGSIPCCCCLAALLVHLHILWIHSNLWDSMLHEPSVACLSSVNSRHHAGPGATVLQGS